jgi:hypothetical protein
MEEFVAAYRIADRALDEANADPDDDLRVLARQFQRAVEKLGISVSRGPTDEERVRWYSQVKAALESVL